MFTKSKISDLKSSSSIPPITGAGVESAIVPQDGAPHDNANARVMVVRAAHDAEPAAPVAADAAAGPPDSPQDAIAVPQARATTCETDVSHAAESEAVDPDAADGADGPVAPQDTSGQSSDDHAEACDPVTEDAAFVPPPQDTAVAALTAGWPSVDLNLIGAMPQVDAPLDIFPDAIADFIRAVAKAIGASEGYVVATLLAMAAAAVGNARIGRVGPEWAVPSILWFLLVGVPASGKSPAMGRTLKPYRTLETECRLTHAAVGRPGMDDDEVAWRQAEAQEGGQNVPAATGPAPQFMCELMTFSGMIDLMTKHRRGMLATADEIAGLIKSMTADLRALFLKSFDGDDFRRNLKNESIDLPRVAMSMVACMQPGILEALVPNLAPDGALARFFVVLGAPQSAGDLDARINDGPVLEMLRRLRALEMDAGLSGPVPRDVPFTSEARDLIADRTATARLAYETGLMEGIIAKSDGTVARLALVLALMRVVSAGPDTPETVEEEDVRGAGRLFDDYLLPMARAAFWLSSCSDIARAGRKVVVKLQADRVTTISVRDLQRMAPVGFNTGDPFFALMTSLTRAGVLRLMQAEPSGPQGGAPSARAMVNPQIWPPGQAPQPS